MYLPHRAWFYCYESRRYGFAGREIAIVKNLNGSSVASDWLYLAQPMLVGKGNPPRRRIYDLGFKGSGVATVICTSFFGMHLKVFTGTPKFAERTSCI